jgi:hypothetical protein
VLYLLVTGVVTAVCWWMWPPLGIAVAILGSGKCRGFVISNAAFWNTGTVMAVGVALGIAMGAGITLSATAAPASTVVKILLLIAGFFAVGYVGFDPAPEDRIMHNKAGQTARIGMLSYVLTIVVLLCVPVQL